MSTSAIAVPCTVICTVITYRATIDVAVFTTDLNVSDVWLILYDESYQESLLLLIIEVKIVKQMPAQTPGKKPTIAIITSKYYEKLAVDAMMDEKTTFVKYKTEGNHKLIN